MVCGNGTGIILIKYVRTLYTETPIFLLFATYDKPGTICTHKLLKPITTLIH